MRAYSDDLRRRVLADCDGGLPTKRVAEKYSVSRAIVRRWKQRRRESGELTARPSGHRKRRIDRERLAELVRAQPDATLLELRERLGIRCSPSAIWMALDALGLTFKKKRCVPPNKIDPTSPQAARRGASGRSGSTRRA